MASFHLNPYQDYLDTSDDRGLKLFTNALDNFKSNLCGKIALKSEFTDAVITEISNLSLRFGYNNMLENVPTERVETAGATPADPVVVTYGSAINFLEVFNDKIVDIAMQHATIIWGDGSFDATQPRVIRDLTIARNEISNHNPPRLLKEGKNTLRDRMHAKFLATHILALLDRDARDAISLSKDDYTWKSPDGRVTEYDGMTILALVLSRVRPHYQVDMFAELAKLKAVTLKEHNNVLPHYFDAISKLKRKMDQKDKTFYHEKQFIRDIFKQLKKAPNDSFAKEYGRVESRWLSGKE